jgi:hypothetical protein
MRRVMAALLLCASVAACAPTPPPDTARVRSSQFDTNGDVDIYSANVAQWYFADPGRARNDPVDALRAVAALDYLAGELSSNPRWTFVSPLTKDLLLNARLEVRQQIGVVPGARSQTVVDSLLAAANAMAVDQEKQGVSTAAGQSAAVRALDIPVFTEPGAPTLTRVIAMPYLQKTNFAVQLAAGQMRQMAPRDCILCI